MTQVYRSAVGFKQALEQRLRTASTTGMEFARRRQLLVFDRSITPSRFATLTTSPHACPNHQRSGPTHTRRWRKRTT